MNAPHRPTPHSAITRRRFVRWGGAIATLGLLPRRAQAAEVVKAPIRAEWPTIGEEIRRAVDPPPLRLRFRGRTPGELAAWQRQFAAKLRELIGPADPPAKWSARTLNQSEFEDHVREELVLTADGAPPLPLYVLRPRVPPAAKIPIVLCLHGHCRGGHDTVAGRDDWPELVEEIRRNRYDYGRQLARAGFLAIAPCFAGFGRRLDDAARPPRPHQFPDSCAMTFIRQLALGRTAVGANLRDTWWALAYAAGRPEAQPGAVACGGMSFGSRMAVLATALEPRISAVVSCGGQTLYQERVRQNVVCGVQLIPGILEYGDTPEIGALIAPRPALWVAGSDDVINNLPIWRDEGRPRLEAAYAASGRPGALSLQSPKGTEAWYGREALEFLARALPKG